MSRQQAPQISVDSVTRVWDRGQHNAFTDLCFAHQRFWLVFREASNHVSDDGVLILLTSSDGVHWALAVELSLAGVDLRDPKLAVMPDGRLMITCAGVLCEQPKRPHQSYLWFSADGWQWSPPHPSGRLGDWIWRSRFIDGQGYGVAYHPAKQATTLYKLQDDNYQVWVDPLLSRDAHGVGYPNEHDLFPLPGHRMGCLLRRDADTGSAKLGSAAAPYRDWYWQDLGVRIGGPVVLPIKWRDDATWLLSAVRLYEPVRTALCWLQPDTPCLQEILSLPSAGDTSYAGLLQVGDRLLCSYYSSHEGKTAIYLAQCKLL